MRIGSLELQNDLGPADWVVDRIHDFTVDVGSVIPEGFESYVRVFHPAMHVEDGDEVPVRRSEIATVNGRAVHERPLTPKVPVGRLTKANITT